MRWVGRPAIGLFMVAVGFSSAWAIDVEKTMKGLMEAATGFSDYVSTTGEISRPENYRGSWAHLGSWVVPAEDAPGGGFHDVYTQPETVKAYRDAGTFPDGAVLVKEIRKVRSADMTTGKAMWAGEPDVWFVMVKDSEGRFPDNPNWGDGWGWALYKADNPDKNVSKDYREDCISCHVPAKETDWVYVKGYPTIR